VATSGLSIECLDRVYLNGYVPYLQVAGQVVSFMTQHLGPPIPSPAIMEKIGVRFRRAVSAIAEASRIPVIRLGKSDRKIEVIHRCARTDPRRVREQVRWSVCGRCG
jgi:hypothetical protein